MTQSPFFWLPLEIRDEIYGLVFGDRLVHLQYLYDRGVETVQDAYQDQEIHRSNAWKQNICDASGRTELRNGTWEPLSHTHRQIWGRSHTHCQYNFVYETLQISVLRTCRRIYEEAKKILWANVSLSLDDAVTFNRFARNRCEFKLPWPRSIRLQVESTFESLQHWNSTIDIAVEASSGEVKHSPLHVFCSRESSAWIPRLITENFRLSMRRLATMSVQDIELAIIAPRHLIQEHRSGAEIQEFAHVLSKNPWKLDLVSSAIWQTPDRVYTVDTHCQNNTVQ